MHLARSHTLGHALVKVQHQKFRALIWFGPEGRAWLHLKSLWQKVTFEFFRLSSRCGRLAQNKLWTSPLLTENLNGAGGRGRQKLPLKLCDSPPAAFFPNRRKVHPETSRPPTQADRDTHMLTSCVMSRNVTLPPPDVQASPPLVWLNGPNSPDSRRLGGERWWSAALIWGDSHYWPVRQSGR